MDTRTYRRYEATVLLPSTVNGPRETRGLGNAGYVIVRHGPAVEPAGWYSVTVAADDASLDAFVDELVGTAHPAAVIAASLADDETPDDDRDRIDTEPPLPPMTSYRLRCGHVAAVAGPHGATTGYAWCNTCGESAAVAHEVPAGVTD